MTILISDISDPRIQEFLSLKKSVTEDHLMVAESPRVVLKALTTGQKVIKIFCNNVFYDQNQLSLTPYNHIVHIADHSLMKKIVGHNLHHGVMALIEKPKPIGLDQLSDKILILNGLTSPENVGTIIRTAASFNIRSIIVDKQTCSPYLRRCIRVSMGNIFFTNVFFSDDLVSTILSLQKMSYTVYGAANTKGASTLNTSHLSNSTAVIIGSEGNGISPEILKVTDKILKIEVEKDVAHINAASAASIFLYQWSISNCLTH